MFLLTRCLTIDPLTQFHSRLSRWVVSFSFIPEGRRKSKKMISQTSRPKGDRSQRWRQKADVERSGDWAKTLQSPPNPVQKNLWNNNQNKIRCSLFFFSPKEWDLFLEKHTQHAFTQGQCCVLAILDPLLQFWTSEWCHGAKMEVGLSCLSVGALAGCWWGGEGSEGVMWVSDRRRVGSTLQRLTPCQVKPYNNSNRGLLVL